MKKQMKWIISAILTIGIVGYFIFSSVKPLKTELLVVKPQTVSQSFKEDGIVQSTIERPIYSLINGTINRLSVTEGQQLEKGELLAEIDSKDLEYQLQQLKAQKKSLLGQENSQELGQEDQDKQDKQNIQKQLGQLKGQLESIQGQEKQANKNPDATQMEQQQLIIEETKRQLTIAKEDYDKIEKLYENGVVAKQEVDTARHYVEQLENTLLQQEQTLKLIEEQAVPLPGTDQYFSGLKNAIQTQIDILEKELKQNSNGTAGTKQYYQGQIESVDAQINQLNDLMSNRKIFSPINGVVKELMVEEGALATTQSPLLILTSPDQFEVEVYLLTEDVIDVKEGMKVTLIQERKNGDYRFAGIVKAIAPTAEEKVSALGLTQQKVKVTIIPEGESPELRPGYALDVLFTTLEQTNKLAVPKVVLFPYEDGDALFIAKKGKAVIQKVEKGMETDELVVIEKGLNAGDQVIKNPQQEGLEQGKKVK